MTTVCPTTSLSFKWIISCPAYYRVYNLAIEGLSYSLAIVTTEVTCKQLTGDKAGIV